MRIPFFERLFPDALFVFLWRDPRENLSSIIEAWKAGRWVTYPALKGFELPWSMLLPPGWEELRGKPLEEIAAAQWDTDQPHGADGSACAATAALDQRRSTAICWRIRARPSRRSASSRVSNSMPRCAARVAAELPPSRHTLTRPEHDKWRSNEAAILRVLPQVEATWRELEALPPLTQRSDIRIAR